MFKNFRLFAQPSYVSGAARLVDLGGVFDKYNKSNSEQEADSRALASDWAAIGNDLSLALDHTSKELLTK
ncbi:MAG TPA: hypothetical protein VN612_15415 [Acidobacteriaceae bacterium]|nr:hypothetical protein [Acidobacteriaceae bacterium]